MACIMFNRVQIEDIERVVLVACPSADISNGVKCHEHSPNL